MGCAQYFMILALLAVSGSYCEQVDEEPVVPIPYSFTYTAGRYPGQIDRVHAETSDGEVKRGMFSYIDPRQKIRTVEYIADKNGFQPILITDPVSDTRAVAAAKEKHQELYNKIAEQHQAIQNEREQLGEEDDGKYKNDFYPPNPNIEINHPRDTPTVEHAKERHFSLYGKIAEEHARIAAERKEENPEVPEDAIYGKI